MLFMVYLKEKYPWVIALGSSPVILNVFPVATTVTEESVHPVSQKSAAADLVNDPRPQLLE